MDFPISEVCGTISCRSNSDELLVLANPSDEHHKRHTKGTGEYYAPC